LLDTNIYIGIDANSIPIYNNTKSLASTAIHKPNIANNNKINNFNVTFILAINLVLGHNKHNILNVIIKKFLLINYLFPS
jgi:hypothetical protein